MQAIPWTENSFAIIISSFIIFYLLLKFAQIEIGFWYTVDLQLLHDTINHDNTIIQSKP